MVAPSYVGSRWESKLPHPKRSERVAKGRKASPAHASGTGGESAAAKTPTGSAGAASETPTAVVGFASFGLTRMALPGRDSLWSPLPMLVRAGEVSHAGISLPLEISRVFGFSSGFQLF